MIVKLTNNYKERLIRGFAFFLAIFLLLFAKDMALEGKTISELFEWNNLIFIIIGGVGSAYFLFDSKKDK